MKITEKDLIGQIKDFPIEVVQKMVERQVEQGNKADVKVFQDYPKAGRSDGYGFTWNETEECYVFWREVIKDKNFDLFFEKYPKKPVNEYPKVMSVSIDGVKWNKRVVFMEKCGKYIAWGVAETIEEADEEVDTYPWCYARDIQPTLTITKTEIAEKFGVPVDRLIIKD